MAMAFQGDPFRQQVAIIINTSSNLKPNDIRFFNPDAEGTENTVFYEKILFYKDVYSFVDRLNDMAVSKNENKIKDILV